MPNRPLSRELRLFSVRFCRPALFAFLIAGAWFLSGASTAANAQATPASNTPAANKPASDTAPGAVKDAQPIAYSHRLHAGDLQIQCAYCHTGVKRSAVAGVPAVGTCTGCHRWVKNKTDEMKKIDDYEQRKQPIFWKRINQLDDYVYFSHKRHVTAGLECQGCHGPVEKMEQVQHIEKLTMGWCVTCHEQRKAPLDCSTCHR